MGWAWPFQGGKAIQAADALVLAVSDASRQPAFFAPGRAADTLEGRLELLTLHGCLALIRLQAAPEARRRAQAFADTLFRHIDAGLREDGVGDLSVPRRMRKIAGQFYGRLHAYTSALEDSAALEAALVRNVFGGTASAYARRLAAYVQETAKAQAACPPEALSVADGWRPAPA